MADYERVDPETWERYLKTKEELPVAQEKAVIAKAHVETVRQETEEKIRKAGNDPAKVAKAEAAAQKSIAYAERCANKAEEDAKKAKKRYEKAKGHALPPWHDLEKRGRPHIVLLPKEEEEEEEKPAKIPRGN
jgi:hypothetical protein